MIKCEKVWQALSKVWKIVEKCTKLCISIKGSSHVNRVSYNHSESWHTKGT